MKKNAQINPLEQRWLTYIYEETMKRPITGKLKGHGLSREAYLYKKAHPIKWQIRQFFKNLFNGKAHNTHK